MARDKEEISGGDESRRFAVPPGEVLVEFHDWSAHIDYHFLSNAIYSHMQRTSSAFAFIHINKCAGTSIATHLGIPTRFHDTALERRELVGAERWRQMFTFAFVRNPFSKVVSHFQYRRRRRNIDAAMPFDLWVQLSYRDKDPRYYDPPKMFQPCLDWISDADGNVIVDFVGRVETIEHDFAVVASRIGVSPELPHLNVSKGERPYRAFYSDESRRIVEAHFRRDLDHFGYEF